MAVDRNLARWSTVLLALALATALLSILTPVALLLDDAPVTLMRNGKIWQTSMNALGTTDQALLWIGVMLPQLAWFYGVLQVARLARSYRRGVMFDATVTGAFERLGIALAVMGTLETLQYPTLNFLLYYRGVSPWLGDMPVLALIQPDLLMAGAFFFVLGKIMRRGAELQETDSLTV